MRRSQTRRWRVVALVAVHVAVLAHVAHWKVAGTTLTPLEPSEAGETLELGYVNAGFLLFVVAALATVVVGRFFCGWACHLVAYQDACAWLLGKVGLRPAPVRSRLLALVPAFAVVRMFVAPTVVRWWSGGALLPELSLHVTTDDLWARFPGFWMSVLTFVVCGALLVWVLGAKAFCTYGCPYGMVFGVADRFAKRRIRVTDDCEACGHCTQVCTSNVRVHEEVALHGMVIDSGCMKCMDCVSVCPKDALYLGSGPTALRRDSDKSRKQDRKRRRKLYDFSWPEEIAMAIVFVAAHYSLVQLYGAVPFLLSLALAVLAALATVALWRLLRSPAMRLQGIALKRGARLTGAGFAALAVIPAYLLFTAHSGFVRYNSVRASDVLSAMRDPDLTADERRAARDRALPYLERVERYSLVDSPAALGALGQIYYFQDRPADAEPVLRRAAVADGRDAAARVLLARILIERERYGEALALCGEAVAADPFAPYLEGTLARLLATPTQGASARDLLERLRSARAEHHAAR